MFKAIIQRILMKQHGFLYFQKHYCSLGGNAVSKVKFAGSNPTEVDTFYQEIKTTEISGLLKEFKIGLLAISNRRIHILIIT